MGVASPIAVNALDEGAAPTRPLPVCSPVSGAVTFAALQIVAGAALPFFAFLLFMLLGASQADAEAGHLLDRLTPQVMAIVWPGAEELGPEEGKPPAIAVYRDGRIAGYIFSTLDIVDAPSFSGIPFDVIAGVDLTGHISGAKVIFHREPHVYQEEIPQSQLDTFLARTAGLASRGGNSGAPPPDYVAGATMTAMWMRDAVFDSAQLVLIGRGLAKVGDAWSMLILRDALHGLRRFDEFEASLGIAPNILADRLGGLVADGMLEKRRYSARPPRFEYWPTDKARDLVPVLLGSGVRFLDELQAGPILLDGPDQVVEGSRVTHLRYQVRRA